MTEQWWLNWDFVLSDNQSLVFANGLTHLVPRMFFNIIRSVSFIWVCFHYLSQQVGALFADVFGHRKLTAKDLLVKFVCVAVFKGQVACHHSIENNAWRPNIRLQAIVSLTCNHLRGSIARWTTGRFECLSFFIKIRKTEVYNTKGIVVVE